MVLFTYRGNRRVWVFLTFSDKGALAKNAEESFAPPPGGGMLRRGWGGY